MAGELCTRYALKSGYIAVAAVFAAASAGALQAQQAPADTQLPEVKVRERPEGEFTTKEAPGVTRSEVPLRDVPASIRVVPRAVIDEQQALRPARREIRAFAAVGEDDAGNVAARIVPDGRVRLVSGARANVGSAESSARHMSICNGGDCAGSDRQRESAVLTRQSTAAASTPGRPTAALASR